jgi:hypothetical protein
VSDPFERDAVRAAIERWVAEPPPEGLMPIDTAALEAELDRLLTAPEPHVDRRPTPVGQESWRHPEQRDPMDRLSPEVRDLVADDVARVTRRAQARMRALSQGHKPQDLRVVDELLKEAYASRATHIRLDPPLRLRPS